MRRRDEQGKVILPFEFNNLLERERMNASLDYYVVEQVCRCLDRWRSCGQEQFKLSVNLSRITLSEMDCVETICAICDRYQIDYRLIQLEITESAETMDDHHLQETVYRFAQEGFGIALDDMGIMYSTIAMLTLKGINSVKLDGSLIRKLEHDVQMQTVLRHIINLCHDLGHRCIAEGIETQRQLEMVKEMGFDGTQGSSLDRLMSIEPLLEK